MNRIADRQLIDRVYKWNDENANVIVWFYVNAESILMNLFSQYLWTLSLSSFYLSDSYQPHNRLAFHSRSFPRSSFRGFPLP